MKIYRCICALLTLVSICFVHYMVQASDETTYFLRAENFRLTSTDAPLSTTVVSSWYAKHDPGVFNYGDGMMFGGTYSAGMDVFVYTDIYLDAGEYRVWAHVGTHTTNPESRWFKLKINEDFINYDFVQQQPPQGATTYFSYWDGGDAASITVNENGFVRLTVVPQGGDTRILGIIITNDETLDPRSAQFSQLQAYEDKAPPIFNGEPTVTDIQDTSAQINWSVTDTALLHMEIYNGSTLIDTVENGDYCVIDNLEEARVYNLTLKAVDRFGQYSQKEITFTTSGTVDQQPPEFPQGAALNADSGKFGESTLTWEMATDNRSILKYEVYNDTQKIADVPHYETSYTVTGLNGGTYTFKVVAVDISGNSSAPLMVQTNVTELLQYFIRPQNFVTPKGTWNKKADTVLFPDGDHFALEGIYSPEAYAYADVFLPIGQYNLWAYVTDNTSGTGSRWFKVKIDEQFMNHDFVKQAAPDGTPSGYFRYWEHGEKIDNKTEGFKRISIVPQQGSIRLYGIIITNDLSANPAQKGVEELAVYQDTTAPSAISISCVSVGFDGVNVLVEASDSEIKGFRVYKDNEPQVLVLATQSVIPLSGLMPLQTYSIKAEALDKLGNVSEATETFSMSPFDVSKFYLADAEGQETTQIAEIVSSEKVRLYYEFTDKGEDIHNAVVIVGVYDKSTDRLLKGEKEELQTIKGGLQSGYLEMDISGLGSNIYFSGYLWDDLEGFHPCFRGIDLK